LSGLIIDLTSVWPNDHANRIYAYLEETMFFSVFPLKSVWAQLPIQQLVTSLLQIPWSRILASWMNP